MKRAIGLPPEDMPGVNTSDPARITLELAQRDIEDIQALTDLAAFDRYFMRRLREKREAWLRSLIGEKMDHERREVVRNLVLEYDNLIGLPAQDRSAAISTITAATSQERMGSF